MSGINKLELPKYDRKMLSDYIESDYPFITDPMPNLYFTRDPFATIGNCVSMNKMYSVTRGRETIYADYIFNIIQITKIFIEYMIETLNTLLKVETF
ncbi:arginine deiminase family protein [Romboutsia sp.]|uniref:arginine deiminase family protein n=1 Tax=Romboutsia sp. TaxID=1965302 RepID=UPI003F3ADD01